MQSPKSLRRFRERWLDPPDELTDPPLHFDEVEEALFYGDVDLAEQLLELESLVNSAERDEVPHG